MKETYLYKLKWIISTLFIIFIITALIILLPFSLLKAQDEETTETASEDMGQGPKEGDIEGATRVLPGPLGGIETILAYSDNMVYAAVVNNPAWYTPSSIARFDITSGTGELVAIDITTGEIAWQKEFPSMNFGAATVVNDLVFTATYDGMIFAFNKTTGEELWSYQVEGGGINAWPAVSGDMILWPAGVGPDPKLIAFQVGDQEQSQEESAPEAFSYTNAPPEINENIDNWPLSNGDYENTREARGSTIDSSNVSGLDVAWTFDLEPSESFAGTLASNPLILEDTVFLQDLNSNVYSINLEDGNLNWEKDYNMINYGPNGPGAGYGKIFVVKGHYEVAALDILTGDELWASTISEEETVGIDIQPVAYNGLVYISTVPGTENENWYSGGGVGIIYALNQEDGEIAWSFNTVDSEDIWGNPEVNSGGGAWFPPAIDTSNGIIYWGIGNPGPWPGTEEFPNGSSRPGPNLYTNSLVALDAASGDLLWYNQLLPHDIFDLDLQNSPVIAEAEIDGAMTNIIIASGKMGIVYVLNRDTGELINDIQVGQHENDTLTEIPEVPAAGTTGTDPGTASETTTSEADVPGDITVEMQASTFNPDSITVATGTTVTWINNDSFSHTVVSGNRGDDDEGSVFRSENMGQGGRFNFTFEEAGTYPYFCSIHPGMQGVVTVFEQ